jgi:hypothetical protein
VLSRNLYVRARPPLVRLASRIRQNQHRTELDAACKAKRGSTT